MKHNYEKTSYYWNDIFENRETYDPKETIALPAVEDALDWVCSEGGTILDFGCGSGRMLLRCLEKGASRTIGVDLSYHAISLSRRTAAAYYETLRTKWIWGDLKSMAQLPDACVNGIILSNVLDNLLPEDGQKLLHVCTRLLDKKGKILLKLSGFLHSNDIVGEGLTQLADENGESIANAYSDSNGVFFWNLSEEALKTMIEEDYTILENNVVEIAEGIVQRIYYLELK